MEAPPVALVDVDEVLELAPDVEPEAPDDPGAFPTIDWLCRMVPWPAVPREPRSCGAVKAAKRSAAITPLILTVLCKSETAMVTVRTAAACEPAASLLARCALYHAKPAAAAATKKSTIQIPNLRGLRGTGWRIAGGGT